MTDVRPPIRSISVAAITLTVALFVQSASIVWWAARIDQRMTAVEQKVADTADTATSLARLDERTASLVTTVNRIDARQNAQDDARLANRK